MKNLPWQMLLLFSLAVGCGTEPPVNNEPKTETTQTPSDETNGSFEAITDGQKLINDKCVRCHQPGGQKPFPDLRASKIFNDAVGKESQLVPGEIIIVSGNAEASLLFRKAAGTQASNEGKRMPLGGSLTTNEIATLKEWIESL